MARSVAALRGYFEAGALAAFVPVPVLGVLDAGVLDVGVWPAGALVPPAPPGVVGTVTPAPGGVPAAPVVAGGAVVAVVVGVLVAPTGAVTVRVTGAGAGPESPASFTSAAARTASARAATTATATIGAFQPGAAARRVRAAAPQCRHHSWSPASGAPHSGQASWNAGCAAGAGGGGA